MDAISPTRAAPAERTDAAGRETLALDVVSDTICPWCYVAKRRIEAAAAELSRSGLDLVLCWRPFELNLDMPVEGMERRAYRSAKFGSWERSRALDAQVAAEASKEGLTFDHARIERTPNTRRSHRLIALADRLGGPAMQDRVVEGLFAAYFTRGRDVGDPATLAEIGVEAGMERDAVAEMLDGERLRSEVVELEERALGAGLSGVPSVIAGDMVLFSGAQRAPLVARAVAEAHRRLASDPERRRLFA